VFRDIAGRRKILMILADEAALDGALIYCTAECEYLNVPKPSPVAVR
jgi:hypothetical protein